ncbi:hypothetical protein [Thermoactinomyces mirandus]|uniref:Uncharacterized protein n=1 Tax=Thermoactinomyces mirandus TaxID=2756294 RepID=A0A7W1XRZ7_9BACL|nr:hypothetical protein [Thermoactinomyces mirandus]MBA4601960.1 hypothetical protein [Thermoactinomyces mirandus]
MSPIYDKHHDQFKDRLKRYVHLQAVEAAIVKDRLPIKTLKLGRVYDEWLDRLSYRIHQDLVKLRQYIQSHGEIVQIRQEKETRIVEYKYNGYLFKMEYLNRLMRVECEELLRAYAGLRKH